MLRHTITCAHWLCSTDARLSGEILPGLNRPGVLAVVAFAEELAHVSLAPAVVRPCSYFAGNVRYRKRCFVPNVMRIERTGPIGVV